MGARLQALLTQRAWPIRLHLALFAIALLAPLLIFSAVLTGHLIRTEHRTNERQLQAMARSISADVDREIAGMISTLKALSNSPSLQTADLAAFYAQAKLTLAPTSRNAVLMDLSGRQLVNTRMTWGQPLPVTERDGSLFPSTVAHRREPHISDLFTGTVSKEALVSVSVPVNRGDTVAYVLVMSMEPRQLLPVFRQAQLPEGWTAEISDRNNRILARSELHEQFLGKSLSSAESATAPREDVMQSTDLQGLPSLHAFHWSELSGWRSAVWVPLSVIEAPLDEFQRWLIVLGGTSLLLATMLAIYFGQRLTVPIAAAAEAGRLLGQGKALKPLASPLSEVNEVVDALRAASVEIRQRTRDLRNSEARLNVAQSLAGLATFEWNLRTNQVLCSDNFRGLFRLPEGSPVQPETLLAVVHPEDRKAVAIDVEHVRKSGGIYEVEFRIGTATGGETRWIAGTGEALLDHDERPHRIIGANYDVTEFKRAAETNAQLAAVVQSSLDAIMSLAPDGTVRTWNPGSQALFGYSPDEIIGRPASVLYPQDAQLEYQETYDELRLGNYVRSDVVRRRKDGSLIDVNVNIAPMHAADGRITGFSAIIRDISDRKQHEQHLRLVMRELSHRSKNLLAVIQAMARQTARSSSDLEEFEKNYSQRLQALSASHDLLVNQNWHGAPLADLLRSILSPFDDDGADRIELIGPSLFVTPTAAQNLALSVHELATNASKYGALSVPTGRVSIEWHMEAAQNGDGQERLRINWKEVGGPVVEKPKRRGFGHIVIDRMVAQALDGEVDLDFAPGGVSWTLQIPASFVVK